MSQESTFNAHLTTFHAHLTTFYKHLTTFNKHLTTFNTHLTTFNLHLTTFNTHLTIVNTHLTTFTPARPPARPHVRPSARPSVRPKNQTCFFETNHVKLISPCFWPQKNSMRRLKINLNHLIHTKNLYENPKKGHFRQKS